MTDVLPVGRIELKDESGAVLFAPLLDITNWELAMCLTLFVKMSLNRTDRTPAWRAMLEEHDLMRHFQPIDTPLS